MNIAKLAALITALGVIIGTAYTLDGRWVLARVYAEEKAAIQMRQLKFEERGIQKQIYDLEDRLANPNLPEKRRGIYEQRLRELKTEQKEIVEEKGQIRAEKGPE